MQKQPRFRADCCCCCGHGVPVELLKRYAKEIPKVELHVHVEGTVSKKLARELLRENAVTAEFYQEDTSCSSDHSSYRWRTTSGTESSRSASEAEPEDHYLTETESTRKGSSADTQQDRVERGGDASSSGQKETHSGNAVSPGFPSHGAGIESQPQQKSRAGGVRKSSITTSTSRELHEQQHPPAGRRSRRADSSSEHCEKRENEQSSHLSASGVLSEVSGGGTALHASRADTQPIEDLWRRDPAFAAEWQTVFKTSSYLLSRKMHFYPSLHAFILDYTERAHILRKPGDYYRILLGYLSVVAADNIRHVEFHFVNDPTGQISLREQLQELHRACCEAKRVWGVTTRSIWGFLRHYPVEDLLRWMSEADDVLHMIDGVGLLSTETGHENIKFAKVFDVAQSRGLHCVAHAGEEGPASNIRDAIKYNHAERIDHGLAAVEDEELLLDLIQRKVPLDVCPLSNVCLGACRCIEEHPLLKCRPQCALRPLKQNHRYDTEEKEKKREDEAKKEEVKEAEPQSAATALVLPHCIVTGSRISRQYPGLIDLGLKVSISSDDPAFFGGGVYNNFRAVIETNRWGEEQRESALPDEKERLEQINGGQEEVHTASTAGATEEPAAGGCLGENPYRAARGGTAPGVREAGGTEGCIKPGTRSGEKRGAEYRSHQPGPGPAHTACAASIAGSGAANRAASDYAECEEVAGRRPTAAGYRRQPVANTKLPRGVDGVELPLLQESLHWRLDTVKQVVINGVEASFLTAQEKQRLLDEIEAFDGRFRRKHSIGPRLSEVRSSRQKV